MTFPNTTGAIAYHMKKHQALLFVWYAISVVFGNAMNRRVVYIYVLLAFSAGTYG
jgi:hypothetical protein